MKSGSLRRRSRIQIAEEKKQEALQKAETQAKLAQYAQMEAKVAELEQFAHNRQMFIDGFHVLKSKGLLKNTDGNTFEVVASFEESEALRKQIADDEKVASQMQKQFDTTPGFGPDPER